MSEISAVVGGMSAISAALDLLKEIRNANKSLQDAEIKLKLANLTESLVDAKLKLSEANQEVLQLREDLRKLHQTQDLRSLLKKEENYYVPLKDTIPGYGIGPWCTNCFEVKGSLISLHKKVAAAMATRSGGFTSYKYECPNCKSTVGAPNR